MWSPRLAAVKLEHLHGWPVDSVVLTDLVFENWVFILAVCHPPVLYILHDQNSICFNYLCNILLLIGAFNGQLELDSMSSCSLQPMMYSWQGVLWGMYKISLVQFAVTLMNALHNSYYHIIKRVLKTRSLTSTGLPISSVSYRTPPTAETPIHGWFTQDPRKTWPVSTARHTFVSCRTTPNPWLDGGGSLQQGAAVDCLARCCEGQCRDHLRHLWAFGSKLSLISICRELWLRQRVGQSSEGRCKWEDRSWRGPGFDLGGCQVVEVG